MVKDRGDRVEVSNIPAINDDIGVLSNLSDATEAPGSFKTRLKWFAKSKIDQSVTGDPYIVPDIQSPDHFEVATANIPHRANRLNSVVLKQPAFVYRVPPARPDAGASFGEMTVAQVPEDAVIESIRDLFIGLSYRRAFQRLVRPAVPATGEH